MSKNLKEHVVTAFGLISTQEWYIKKAESGLWGSEEVLIRKYFKPNSTILDIGCGTGRTTIHLQKLGYKVKGIDITPAMINNARGIAKLKNLKIDYEMGDVTELKYKNSSFDNAIFSFNGWAMIPRKINRAKALEEIFRVLKPGGYFIFTSLLRNLREFKKFWIKQWVKLNIQKPLGFIVKEVDFGDYFYEIESTNKSGNQKQYMHRPSLTEVKNQISKIGFNLIYFARGNTISSKKTGEAPPMFFVCKKLI